MKNFRYSDVDFVTFMIVSGKDVSYMANEEGKVYFHFEEEFEDFKALENKYRNQNVRISMKEFSSTRKEVVMMIKNYLKRL